MQLNMQRIQEHPIIDPKNKIGMIEVIDFDEEFEKLSDNYTLQDKEKIKNFIKNHENILSYIHEITPLINNYFPHYQKIITFCEDPEFSELDFVMIYIKGFSYDEDYKNLKRFENEPLFLSKFSRNINGLLCVDLW